MFELLIVDIKNQKVKFLVFYLFLFLNLKLNLKKEKTKKFNFSVFLN
jgi:hypothetical protein